MRFPDWPERLAAFIAGRERMPFAWGSNDCCSFAGDAVLALTGEDPMKDLRGYHNAWEAACILDAGLCRLVGDRLERCAASLALRGDVVLAVLERRESLLVVEGDSLVGPGASGLVRIPRARALVAWRV